MMSCVKSVTFESETATPTKHGLEQKSIVIEDHAV